MNVCLSLAPALLAGILLGAFYFGGLWWTIQRGLSSKQPALWFFGSLLLRMCVVMLGFYFILGDNWVRLLAGLSGFILTRLIATRIRPMVQEGGHAP